MSPRRKAARAGADVVGLERAFEAFLRASGAPSSDPELAGTARRAALAWADEFLDGYRTEPAEALGELSPAPAAAGIVIVKGLDYVGVCPHHLLPYRGVAHLAYLPGKSVAGFGRFAALVDALGHRLLLQEALAGQLVSVLVEVLGAKGAAVILDSEQTCLSMRGERRARSRTAVEAAAGRQGAKVLASLRASLAGGGAGA